MIEQSGLSRFICVYETLMDVHSSYILSRSMIEWWWDTTNSFNMPWGEMTITPLDFSLIFGLSFIGIRVPLADSLVFNSGEVRLLIGFVSDMLPQALTYTSRTESSRGVSSWMGRQRSLRFVFCYG